MEIPEKKVGPLQHEGRKRPNHRSFNQRRAAKREAARMAKLGDDKTAKLNEGKVNRGEEVLSSPCNLWQPASTHCRAAEMEIPEKKVGPLQHEGRKRPNHRSFNQRRAAKREAARMAKLGDDKTAKLNKNEDPEASNTAEDTRSGEKRDCAETIPIEKSEDLGEQFGHSKDDGNLEKLEETIQIWA